MTAELSPIDQWRRAPRSSITLSSESGVYALILRRELQSPALEFAKGELLYIGMADGRDGLRGRCHFSGRTVNHSPRKSLAVMLLDVLALNAVLVTKRSGSSTWGLDEASDAALSAWMHSNLDLAIEVCADVAKRETELIGRYAPPLNLKKCIQTARHRRISAARTRLLESLRGEHSTLEYADYNACESNKAKQVRRPLLERPGLPDIQTAEGIATQYDLDPKAYRQKLREVVTWYCKPQRWAFPLGSPEYEDMIRVAKALRRYR